MTDFNSALATFIAAINADGEDHYKKHLSNLTYNPVERAGGKKYIRLVNESRVYCFVAAVDVPANGIKEGDVLMAASYKAPALKRKNPAAANIFKPATYEGVNKSNGCWLYAG